jgi:tight adherence protein C
MTPSLQGALVGLLLVTGLLVVVSRVPAFRRPRLDDRLAPYLRDTPRPSRLLGTARPLTPFPTLERIAAPVLRDAAGFVERLLGGTTSVRQRLDRAGSPMSVEEFRAEQVLWGGAGLLGGLGLGILAALDGSIRPIPFLVLAVVLLATGVLGRDRWLTREVTRREARMMVELPTVAELLALAVAAGEGAVGALERVTRQSSGELAKELSRALADARAGASLVQALDGLSTRTGLPALARFVDGVAVAVERGTPLADVLRAQAVDVREAGKRSLLEAGGRKEIAMMVPVVFLVLPVTVVFALFPGFYGFSFAG